MTKILKFQELNLINEYSNYNFDTFTDNEVMELSNISDEETGIDNIILWIGPNSDNDIKRIKVCNLPNYLHPDNCFTLTIPDFTIIGYVNTELITTDVLNKIKQFVNLNIDIINSYSNYEILTKRFLDNLKSIK